MNRSLYRLFNLRRDQDDPDSIDADIRAGAEPVGANLWVLFFAILIASVGLNVNSTAVIIGAMLVSPLMGPLVAIGYGAAVQDLPLIRGGAKALLVFVVLSLLTSTLYFTLSPLDQPGSELMARTTPTLWDVLIAIFGGGAGMVAATRKEGSNVVPGVAIATALMPPLCTVSFGLAHARWNMVFGAAYLFVINGVFIAASTLVVAKLVRLPQRGSVDPTKLRRNRILLAFGITLVVVPSIVLGYRFVQLEIFNRQAQRVAEQLQSQQNLNVVSYQADASARTLRLTLLGGHDEKEVQALADAMMREAGLSDAKVQLRLAGDAPLNVTELRRQLQSDVNNSGLVNQLRVTEARLNSLQQELEQFKAAQVASAAATKPDSAELLEEVHAQYPQVRSLTLAHGLHATATGRDAGQATLVLVQRTRPLNRSQHTTLLRWLRVRLNQPALQLLEQPA
jgi:uncharacterized hydrophobic protein (TIGR00271 family)